MKKIFAVGPDLLGEGKVMFEWSPKGNYLAAAGPKRKVNIVDRNGKLHDEVHFPAPEVQLTDGPRSCGCAQLQWDPSGEQLAILPAGNTFVYVWAASTSEVQKIDTEFKTQELTCLAWSRSGVLLAIGTSKGNLLLYNCRERRKTPYVGKHTKKIVAAAWGRDNRLGLAGLDRMITVTDGSTGETVKSFPLKNDPMDLCVAERRDDGPGRKEEVAYSVNINRKTLYIMQSGDAGDRPTELAFLEQYGPIQRHAWLGDSNAGYVALAFRSGVLVVISTRSSEISEEVHSGKYLDVLSDMAHCPVSGRIALAGASSVRIVDASGSDYSEVKADAVELPDASHAVERVGWTKDGQVLTVGSNAGVVQSYLAALPVVFDACGTRVAHLTSLLEVSLVDVQRRFAPTRIEIQAEPSFCGLGPAHVAVGMNNQVWFYSHSGALVNRRDYVGTVASIKLNEGHAAVLTGGLVVVHPLEPPAGAAADESDVLLPPSGQQANITCAAITRDFVITGSRGGLLCYYLVPGLQPVNEYRHDDGAILRLWPQPAGPRLVMEDERGGLSLFNPVNDSLLTVPQFTGRAEAVLWDVADPNVFVIADGSQLHVFLHMATCLAAPGTGQVLAVGRQPLGPTHTPLVCNAGVLGCRLKSGALDSVVLDTHRALQANDAVARANPQRRFAQALKLYRLKEAWECALQLRSSDAWRQLGTCSLEALDVDMALAAHRMLGDASMVLALGSVRGCEDRSLLAGHVMVLLDRDVDVAQELFLRSSMPRAALDMRKDLKHWPQALRLAEQLDPDNTAAICKEHAAALEMVGEYAAAKTHYQQALDSLAVHTGPPSPGDEELRLACRSGICRTTLQMGDLRQGRSQALNINTQPLYKECAAILEGLQQLAEAAEMWERAGQYERAASIYIQTKNFNAAAPLMARITSAKLQLQFAKAKEAEGRFAEAAQAYEVAGDMDSVVRLCLERLNAPQRAYALVRKTQSVEAATMLARFCLQAQDFQGAVEFLLMAKQQDQAFDIAQGHNEMDTFARVLALSVRRPDEFSRIAQYYESRGEYDKAGDMWAQCAQHARAVQLYLKVGTDAALLKAIGAVEQTKSAALGVLVLDFVNEQRDGAAKDGFRFKLNIAMDQYLDAARDAMEMARFEQEEGNYRVAHDKLFGTYRQLEGLSYRPPTELVRALMLVHSYTLVKSLVAINDHAGAARMLVRVARNISKFPKHVVPILTSTVIECHRAGLKKTAFEYASMLMRPEYRNDVAVKYKKKIELMVRKPDKDPEEAEEGLADCPLCSMPGPETELHCVSCQNIIPFDIATGKRMVLSDWAECPSCKLPCSAQHFIRILAAERRCPMCNVEVDLGTVRKVLDPLGQLRKRNETLKTA